MASWYDPPSGWMYGFPKLYEPREGESVAETLIRDGYPRKDAKWAAQHTRWWGASPVQTSDVQQ